MTSRRDLIDDTNPLEIHVVKLSDIERVTFQHDYTVIPITTRYSASGLRQMHTWLKENGLTPFPLTAFTNNPNPQPMQEIRVILSNTLAARFIDAVERPSLAGDQLLNDYIAKNAEAKLRDIRAILDA